jgi:hypothetical protein
MSYYAIFYANLDGQLVKPCGTYSVVRLDGRKTLKWMHEIAKREAHMRGYDGYQLVRGNLRDPSPISALVSFQVSSSGVQHVKPV